MSDRRNVLAPLAMLGLLLAAAPAPAAEDAPARTGVESQANVRVTIRVGRLEHGQRRVLKTYHLMVTPETRGSKLLSGARVPLPVGGDAADKTFVYQNIGFSADVSVWILPSGKIKLMAELEDSRVVDNVTGRPPVVETRQLSVNTVLTDGKPMEVTRVEGETDPSGFVEIEAKTER